MKNIRLVLLGEIVLLVLVFCLLLVFCDGGLYGVTNYWDIPSILIMVIIMIPGMMIMGTWKDFKKSFSVGIKEYSLLELKNIVAAVDVAQKLAVFAAIFTIIITSVVILKNIAYMSTLGPNFAVCFLSALYAVIIEFLLLPLRLNAQRKMNEEMDFEEE